MDVVAEPRYLESWCRSKAVCKSPSVEPTRVLPGVQIFSSRVLVEADPTDSGVANDVRTA